MSNESEKLRRDGLYPLRDMVPLWAKQQVSDPSLQGLANIIRARWTGERRAPKKDEWYLSGAVIEAYCAPNDLTMEFHIAELVETRQGPRVVIKALSPIQALLSGEPR